jgi:hypothetical protein
MFKNCEQKVYNLSIVGWFLNNRDRSSKRVFKSGVFLNLLNTLFEQENSPKNQFKSPVLSTLSTALIITRIVKLNNLYIIKEDNS